MIGARPLSEGEKDVSKPPAESTRPDSSPVDVTDLARQHRLIAACARKLQREHGSLRMFETHISWVLVAGACAWKVKKAVRFDFIDFSSLDARRRCCEEELRLNRRLAPEIYLSVVAIGGSLEDPVLDGNGRAMEYAVKMRSFSQDALWSERIGQGVISPADIDDLAQRLAAFHRDAAASAQGSPWCRPDMLERTASEVFSGLASLAPDDAARSEIADLRESLNRQAGKLRPVFMERKLAGSVRECHGDLHCANVITVDGRSTAFDCIEFNDAMRWIDVMNDLAFLCMDLECRGRADLAFRLMNAYLEHCGDYGGLRVFRYYRTLRALIRCLVAWLRAAQSITGSEEASRAWAKGRTYLDCAKSGEHAAQPAIVITHGLSGSGKSSISGMVLERLGAVRMRSDIERKRLYGLNASDRSGGDMLYGATATHGTYARLESLAMAVAGAGWPVIIDAAFLQREQRQRFRLLAARLGIPFVILDVHAGEAILRSRVAARAEQGRDASDAGVQVLLSQIAGMQALDADETRTSIRIDTTAGIDASAMQTLCDAILNRIRGC
jgi:aminoglycoside phosphotransferase family enzyme/predicted kinase